MTKKSLLLPGVEPWIRNRPTRSLHPSVRDLSHLQGKQSINLWCAFLPHFRTNVNHLAAKPFFSILDIGLVAGQVFFWLWLAVLAVNETPRRVSSWNCSVFSLPAFRVTFATLAARKHTYTCARHSLQEHYTCPPGHSILYSWLHCMLMAGKLWVSSYAAIVLRDTQGLTATETQAGSRLRSLQLAFSQPVSLYIDLKVRLRVRIGFSNQTQAALRRRLVAQWLLTTHFTQVC